MTKAEAIKKMFPHKNQTELSDIWKDIFLPQLSAITGKPEIHPILLDDIFVEEYGNYEGSFGDVIQKKFGDDVLKAILN